MILFESHMTTFYNLKTTQTLEFVTKYFDLERKGKEKNIWS